MDGWDYGHGGHGRDAGLGVVEAVVLVPGVAAVVDYAVCCGCGECSGVAGAPCCAWGLGVRAWLVVAHAWGGAGDGVLPCVGVAVELAVGVVVFLGYVVEGLAGGAAWGCC